MHWSSDLVKASLSEIYVLLTTDHSDAGPASCVGAGQTNVIAVARIGHKPNAGLGVVLIHGLGEQLLVLLGCWVGFVNL